MTVTVTNTTTSTTDWLRRTSVWRSGEAPRLVALDDLSPTHEQGELVWFELCCDPHLTEPAFAALAPHCPGLTHAMLEDLVTPDDEPKGLSYDHGSIRLASTFGVRAHRQERQVERGTPQGIGVLEFQPVELLADDNWLITCWHPVRVFQGTEKIREDAPGSAKALFDAIGKAWEAGGRCRAGDLGVAVMGELALGYEVAIEELSLWLDDWELGLYTRKEGEELACETGLPELWGLMAMLRAWIKPLNRPGLCKDVARAWLPATDQAAVAAVGEEIRGAGQHLAKLGETLRQSFNLFHLEQTEEQRMQGEKAQKRFEIAGVAFLVPTLIVGFYGANTWVPGQGRHWGFWVMVVILVLFSFVALAGVWAMQRRQFDASRERSDEHRQLRTRVLREG